MKTIEVKLGNAESMTRGFIAQLEGLRVTTPNPVELEWEIRVYQFILEEPEKRLDQYFQARHQGGLRSKRSAVASLGWVIP